MLRAVFLVPFLVAAACSGGGTPVYTLNASAAHDCATGRIVFAAEADGQFDLFVVNADGTGLAALTDTPVDEFSPSWSADGARIVFTRAVEGVHKIFSMAEDGTDVRQEAAVGSRVGSGAVACAPVGDGIAFLRPDASGVIQVWTGTLGGGATQLTTDGDDKTAVDWSPDGTEIVYASNSGAGGPDPGATTLFLTVLGGATTQLAQIEGSIDDLSWSSTDLIAASRQFILETVGFVLEVQIYETSGTLLGSAP
ncbi:MAG: hypothetical protein OER88_14900, partial [Planctomycetota bacterium]|nr:hypothetical protein [Planctomycetota bacterium]